MRWLTYLTEFLTAPSPPRFIAWHPPNCPSTTRLTVDSGGIRCYGDVRSREPNVTQLI